MPTNRQRSKQCSTYLFLLEQRDGCPCFSRSGSTAGAMHVRVEMPRSIVRYRVADLLPLSPCLHPTRHRIRADQPASKTGIELRRRVRRLTGGQHSEAYLIGLKLQHNARGLSPICSPVLFLGLAGRMSALCCERCLRSTTCLFSLDELDSGLHTEILVFIAEYLLLLRTGEI
jgi:hypothetical protein